VKRSDFFKGMWLSPLAVACGPRTPPNSLSTVDAQRDAGLAEVLATTADTFNVKSWGVVGDGVVDDTAAFQAVLSAAATNKNSVFIPANTTLRITSALTCAAVRIVGESRNTSRIFVDFDGVCITADADSASSFEMRNITMTGELVFTWTLPTRTSQVGLKISTTHNSVVKNCVFLHLYRGLQLEGAGYYNLIEGNLFTTCLFALQTLLLSSDGPSEANIVYNQFSLFPISVGGPGATVAIQLDAGSGHKIIGNGIENCDIGIALGTSQFCILIGNRHEDNNRHITQDASVTNNTLIGGFDDTIGNRTFVGNKWPSAGPFNVVGNAQLLGDLTVGVSADLNTSNALNGTGGGNRGFDDSFTGASATAFTGTDSADQGYGYFPVTIVSGRRYRVSATMVATNGAVLRFVTSTGLNFATDLVQEVEAASTPPSGLVYEFTASGDATHFGIAASRSSGTMSLTVSSFSFKRLGLIALNSSGDVLADGDVLLDGALITTTVTTLADDATPSVSAGNLFKTGGTTTITNLDDGMVGQTIRILSGHAITITDGTNILLNGSGDFVMAAGDVLVLTMYNDQVWVEDSRQVRVQ
jgi:hypothetical protein